MPCDVYRGAASLAAEPHCRARLGALRIAAFGVEYRAAIAPDGTIYGITSGGEVKLKPYRRQKFASRYTRADIEVLAQTGEAHDALSGPATVKIMEREHRVLHTAPIECLWSSSDGRSPIPLST